MNSITKETNTSADHADRMRVGHAAILLAAPHITSRRKGRPALSTSRERAVIDGPFAETKEFIGSRA